MRATTLEVVWHDKQPVLSVDFHPDGTLATAGADREIRLWQVVLGEKGSPAVKPICSLANHTQPINSVRFSPDGSLLASGGARGELLLWRPEAASGDIQAPGNLQAAEGDAECWKYTSALRGHNEDVNDLAWSPDGTALLSGSVEGIALLWDVKSRKGRSRLEDHKGYVQGVAWDPLGEILVTQGADKTCRIYGPRPPAAGKAAPAVPPQASARLRDFSCQAVVSRPKALALLPQPCDGKDRAADGAHAREPMLWGENLGFFKRLSWSPDGSFLAVPGGRLRASMDSGFMEATLLFKRGCWSDPVVYLPSPGEVTLAVRFSPVLYRLRDEAPRTPSCFDLPYRMIFAVATASSVLVYDTQEAAPITLLGRLHFDQVTDLAWSPDGSTLVCSSYDGYCSLAVFESGELGVPLPEAELPAHLVPKPLANEAEDDTGSASVHRAASDNEAVPRAAPNVSAEGREAANRIAPSLVDDHMTVDESLHSTGPQNLQNSNKKRIVPEALQLKAAAPGPGHSKARRIVPTPVGDSSHSSLQPAVEAAEQKKRRIVPTPCAT